ncbi:agenet domain-containing protein [Paramagnetospirillum magneticum]|uniref:Agenet-like domain-containing protein n=1 Tax=Paramagnetospirillum magneticum (strain ATCC 700264 / AMB-1) TaxID=342108 RepID=Q2W269_PARM1|nr:agenet domain-containing protein [Paramagnetospirillum magneticum]BAE52056.1 hypothetical protein amb3252 [Paramagnetospirillum magneticum AMB-1]
MKLNALGVIAAATLAVLTSTSAFAADLCPVGKSVKVNWKGDWYPAKVTKAEPARCFIAYDGYGREDDEWVGPDRLPIKVSWKGEWYPAKVIQVQGDKYKIHYDGYASSDDEVVDVSRIQVR